MCDRSPGSSSARSCRGCTTPYLRNGDSWLVPGIGGEVPIVAVGGEAVVAEASPACEHGGLRRARQVDGDVGPFGQRLGTRAAIHAGDRGAATGASQPCARHRFENGVNTEYGGAVVLGHPAGFDRVGRTDASERAPGGTQRVGDRCVAAAPVRAEVLRHEHRRRVDLGRHGRHHLERDRRAGPPTRHRSRRAARPGSRAAALAGRSPCAVEHRVDDEQRQHLAVGERRRTAPDGRPVAGRGGTTGSIGTSRAVWTGASASRTPSARFTRGQPGRRRQARSAGSGAIVFGAPRRLRAASMRESLRVAAERSTTPARASAPMVMIDP